MWEEWAKAHNTTTNAMTQAQKIEAEYNGIMQETRFQVGDATAYTKTFSGQIQQLKFLFNQMTVAIGKVVTPIAQLFIPIINTAIQVVTRFFENIQSALKIFGLEMPDVISKSTSGFSNMSDNIKSTGDSAVKAAKKINKAFGPLDEINVLKTSDSSSCETSSGDTNSNVSITPTISSDSAISEAVNATVEKIKKYVEPLKEIGFDNLINAFERLKDSTSAFGKNIAGGLEWLYFNILVPLSKWTIEDILPSFLNILSGALDIVNQALMNLQPIWQWFWDNFLSPILSWTGGVIVDVLNGIGNALKWIADNEFAMTLLESLGITIGVIAGAIAVYNGVMAICNVVTGVFSGIMAVLTDPITLVVAGIASLIAIIVLLVKHWDSVKKAASACWEWIKYVWNNAATWVNNTIVRPISNFFTNMWNNLKAGASQAWEGIKSVFSPVANWFKNQFTKAWTAVKNVFSTGGKIFNGIKEGIANVFRTVVNGIISGINKVISVPFKTINKMLNKIRNISFLDISPFKKLWKENPLAVPQIPMLAQGDWVPRNEPQLAVIGDNTREGEIVAPESKIYDQVVKGIKDSGINSNNNQKPFEMHLYVHYEDGRIMINKINQTQIEAGEILLLS